LLLLLFLSCSNIENDKINDYVIDDIGNKLSISKSYSRIISLAPSITEIIYFIKSDTLLIGVTDFCNFPPEAENKAKIGGILNPNLEKITELKPDLILMTAEGNSNITYQNLKGLGFEIMVFNPKDFNSIISSINKISKITKKEYYAKIKTDSLSNIINEYKSNNSGTKKSAFIMISMIPLITVNKTNYINDILENIELSNVYENEKNFYPEISFEDLTSKKPDYYIIPFKDSNSKANIIEFLYPKLQLTYNELSKKTIFIEEDLIMRPGPRLVEAIQVISKGISSSKAK
jgi:iron complex transport system substrate-binding protein